MMEFYRSGSPAMTDIEAFSAAYRTRLDEAEQAKTIPENISLEVLHFSSATYKILQNFVCACVCEIDN